ncbi:MAG: GMC oxidoreductase [Planctomycetota bacterium]|jgi:choline dehydrogenase-like flavoprotein
MERDFDVIVIGSGAGGAAFAHACASAGRHVLVIERGRRPDPAHRPLDEQDTLIDKVPYDDREFQVNDVPLRLYMGGVVGGSTAVYGGAMLRPSVDDFHPGRRYADRLDQSLWDWPVSYEDLQPFYDEAESLYRLAADQDADYGTLNPPGKSASSSVLPIAPINRKLITRSQAAGLSPFQLPLAIDTARCQSCDACAGFLCPHGARRSAGQILSEVATESSLNVMTNTNVDRFERDSAGQVCGVVVQDRTSGQEQHLRAACYALAAGAIGSPAILLKSGIDGLNIGRNYMMHYSPIAVGVFARSTGADETFIKQIGFTDFYFGTDDCPHKMGLVQSLPAPGPLMLKKTGLKNVPTPVLRFLRRRLLPLAGIVEDLPDPKNRVFLRNDGTIGLTHDFSRFDEERGASLGRAMCRILRHAGAVKCTSRSFPSREHVAHQCGTLRFGNDPAHAVVDADCRMFGQENLFVVDGSVLPTSTGVGPSLTIAANALRVAQVALAAI